METRFLNPKRVKEDALAKLNLALHVTGQRPDGYHLLDSLVVFAGINDRIICEDAHDFSFRVTGPEAAKLSSSDDNLVLRAARALEADARAKDGVSRGARLTLEKHLPVAAGIGGGSADAAATLRALNTLWFLNYEMEQLLPIAEALGADVPACLYSETLRMSGIGDTLDLVTRLPYLNVILINPGHAVSTQDVFARLIQKDNGPLPDLPAGKTKKDWLDWLAHTRNDLLPGALDICPDIADCLTALEKTGAAFTTMSGSGATVVGIYHSYEQVQDAFPELDRQYPDWWMTETFTC